MIIEKSFLFASSPVLRHRICSVRRDVQRDRHGRTHQAPKSQLPLLFKLFSQDPDPCPRRPEGHVSPSRSHSIVERWICFFFFPSPTFLHFKHFAVLFCVHSCSNDSIHKDLRKAVGANSIFYNAQNHELIVLVSATRRKTYFLCSCWRTHTQTIPFSQRTAPRWSARPCWATCTSAASAPS